MQASPIPLVSTMLGLGSFALFLLGADSTPWELSRQTVLNGHLWSLMTYSLFHLTFAHLLLDVLTTVVLGVCVEKQFGMINVIMMAVTSVVLGGIVHIIFDPQYSIVGLSCVTYGWVGVFTVILLKNNLHRYAILISMYVIIKSYLAVVGFEMSILELSNDGLRIASLAHMGGYVGGVMPAFVLYRRRHSCDIG